MPAGARSSVFRSNVKWQVASSAGQAALSGAVLLILGRYLSAGGFGTYSVIMGFVVVANLALEPRMQDVVAKKFWDFGQEADSRQRYREDFVDFLLFEATCKLLPCVALVLLAVPITRLADIPSNTATLIVVAAVGNYTSRFAFGLSTGLLRVLGRSDLFAFCLNGETILRLALLGTLALTGHLTVASAIIVFVVTGTLANVVQLSLAMRYVPRIVDTLKSWRARPALARLSSQRRLLLSNIGLSGSDLMNKDLDVTMLSPLVPTEQIGVYKMAKNIAQLAWRAIDPFTLSLMPELNRRISMNDFQGTRALLRLTALGLAALATGLAIACYAGLALFGTAVFGREFSGMTSLIPWMLLGIIIGAPLVWGHPLAVALNRADLAFMGNLLSLAVGLASFVVLVALVGITGAAIAWALTFLPFFVFTSIAAIRLLRQREAEARA
jgi:O-antigen/teichoic acid export membrane protein